MVPFLETNKGPPSDAAVIRSSSVTGGAVLVMSKTLFAGADAVDVSDAGNGVSPMMRVNRAAVVSGKIASDRL